MPKHLLYSLYKLIEFYQKGNPNDDEKIIAFMKEHSILEILANKEFWGQDLSFLYDEVMQYDYQ